MAVDCSLPLIAASPADVYFTWNQKTTVIPVFFLKGLPEVPGIQSFLSGLFLSLYLVTIFGNLLIVLATISDSHLHVPCPCCSPACHFLTLRHFHYRPKYAGGHPDTEQGHYLCRLQHPDGIFQFLDTWMIYFCDGP
ncbi:Olfactory receptor 7A10 [Sciurus carolinensis]|uniref:Olfactory receptor 7A10 n=1 Tax=Sciurus carolinensis TaxID=30640 RepID=A0AA41N2W7_SCICA|nr:Olfactory receptor 7A10 [Sciurus carolinensis]